jgi:hypothetical protein
MVGFLNFTFLFSYHLPMKPETKITKIERTDADVDNSRYIIISYDEVVDDE